MFYFSDTFLFFFLPFTYLVHLCINKYNNIANQVWLIVSSSVFFMFWGYQSFLFIFFSLTINYLLCLKLIKKKNKHTYLLGILINCFLILIFFQNELFNFHNFFVNTASISTSSFFIPLALSFYSLQQIYYLKNVYEDDYKELPFTQYCLAVIFFPKILVGPFYNLKDFCSQIAHTKTNKGKTKYLLNIKLSLTLLVIGYCKTILLGGVLLGDYSLISSKTLSYSNFTFVESWLLIISYTFYFYFTYSGLCDMATGILILFGMNPKNSFNSPLTSHNLVEFWKRWNITLVDIFKSFFKTFTKEYPKIPVFIVLLLLFALWHGVAANFLIWAFLQGLGIYVFLKYNSFKKTSPNFNQESSFKKYVSCLITFLFITTSFVFFLSDNVSLSLNILKGLVGLNSIAIPMNYSVYFGPFLDLIKNIGIEFVPDHAMPLFKGFNHITTIILITLIVFCLPSSSKIRSYIAEPKLIHRLYNINIKSSTFDIILAIILSITFFCSYLLKNNEGKYTHITFYPLVSTLERSIGCKDDCGSCYRGFTDSVAPCRLDEKKYKKFKYEFWK